MKCSPLLAAFLCSSFVPNKSHASRLPEDSNDGAGSKSVWEASIEEAIQKSKKEHEEKYKPLNDENSNSKRPHDYLSFDSDGASKGSASFGEEVVISASVPYSDIDDRSTNYSEIPNEDNVTPRPLVIPDNLCIAPQLQNIIYSLQAAKSGTTLLIEAVKDIRQITDHLMTGLGDKFDPLVNGGLSLIMETFNDYLDLVIRNDFEDESGSFEDEGYFLEVDVEYLYFNFAKPRCYFDHFNKMVIIIKDIIKSDTERKSKAIEDLANVMVLVHLFQKYLHPGHKKLDEYKYFYHLLQAEIKQLMKLLNYDGENIIIVNEEALYFIFSDVYLPPDNVSSTKPVSTLLIDKSIKSVPLEFIFSIQISSVDEFFDYFSTSIQSLDLMIECGMESETVVDALAHTFVALCHVSKIASFNEDPIFKIFKMDFYELIKNMMNTYGLTTQNIVLI